MLPPRSHRVTQSGGDVTCMESASGSELHRQSPDCSRLARQAEKESVSVTFASSESQKWFSAKRLRTELYRLFNKTTSVAAAVDTQLGRRCELQQSLPVPLLNV